MMKYYSPPGKPIIYSSSQMLLSNLPCSSVTLRMCLNSNVHHTAVWILLWGGEDHFSIIIIFSLTHLQSKFNQAPNIVPGN